MSNADALNRFAIRETIEAYLSFLDEKSWEGIAACFTADARSHYNFEPEVLQGGSGVVEWIRTRLAGYEATHHALGNLRIVVDGDFAVCNSRVTASLLYATGGERRIAVRAIQYQDRLRRDADRWRICERRHEPQWQYDVAARNLRV